MFIFNSFEVARTFNQSEAKKRNIFVAVSERSLSVFVSNRLGLDSFSLASGRG